VESNSSDLSVRAAARLGQREGLEAMRDRLADAMDLAEPSVVAQIAGRLQAVLKELAELSKGSEVGLEDVLAERRKARVAAAKPRTPTRRRSDKRSG
jgi:hypothetical protein